jgi:hypothetical protein
MVSLYEGNSGPKTLVNNSHLRNTNSTLEKGTKNKSGSRQRIKHTGQEKRVEGENS